jgi:hypothetical protein
VKARCSASRRTRGARRSGGGSTRPG